MNLVFCHLGSKMPSYLHSNLVRTNQLFPEHKVFLISSNTPRRRSHLLKIGIHFVDVKPFPIFDKIIQGSKHNQEFRNGFWRYSLERLFVVCNFAIENTINNVLHIESDVVLYPNFPFEELQEKGSINWGFYNEKRDVASLLYLNDSTSALWLRDNLIDNLMANPHHTDMSILKDISIQNKPRITYFPMAIDLIRNRDSTIRADELCNVVDQSLDIRGIFDSAAIGMWLTGQDARNSYGFKRMFSMSNIKNGDSAIDPSIPQYFMRENKSIIAKIGEEELPLYCVHVHSKNMRFFKLKDSREWRKVMKLLKLYNSQEIIKFDIKAFLNLFWINLRRVEIREMPKRMIRFVSYILYHLKRYKSR